MTFRMLMIAFAVVICLSSDSQAQLIKQSPNETPDFPAIINKTKSVAIVSIKPIGSTLINYQFTLQNLSDKDIKAVNINVLSEGHLRIVSMPQGYYGKTFIKARESRSLPESLTTSPYPRTYNSPTPRGVQIVIESVIFEDGSYEGDLKSAGIFLGALVGSRIEVRRILPLLENALSVSDAVSASDALRKQLKTLSVMSPMKQRLPHWWRSCPLSTKANCESRSMPLSTECVVSCLMNSKGSKDPSQTRATLAP